MVDELNKTSDVDELRSQMDEAGENVNERQFEYNGHDCRVRYDGSLPNYTVDGQVIPSGVVREDDIHHVGEPINFWVEALKDYVDSLE